MIVYAFILRLVLLLFRGARWYVWNILIAIDQLANALIGGDHDETISSRAHKGKSRYICWAILCWFLEKIDPNHCQRVVECDEGEPCEIVEGKN